MVDYTHVYLLYFVFIIPSQRHVKYLFFCNYIRFLIFKDSIFLFKVMVCNNHNIWSHNFSKLILILIFPLSIPTACKIFVFIHELHICLTRSWYKTIALYGDINQDLSLNYTEQTKCVYLNIFSFIIPSRRHVKILFLCKNIQLFLFTGSIFILRCHGIQQSHCMVI